MPDCHECNRPIKRNAIAYRAHLWPLVNPGTPDETNVRGPCVHYCKGCVPEHLPRDKGPAKVHTCQGCGFKEGWFDRRPVAMGEYCGWLCKRAAKARAAREARAALTCQGCGQPVDATRGDARFCSNACRQRAYRRRNSVAR